MPRSIRLRFRHRYEVDPKYIPTLEQHGMIFSGKHPAQPIMQILELPQDVHPYFLGTQAHPELTSRPLRPQPMFMGLVQAAVDFAKDAERIAQQPSSQDTAAGLNSGYRGSGIGCRVSGAMATPQTDHTDGSGSPRGHVSAANTTWPRGKCDLKKGPLAAWPWHPIPDTRYPIPVLFNRRASAPTFPARRSSSSRAVRMGSRRLAIQSRVRPMRLNEGSRFSRRFQRENWRLTRRCVSQRGPARASRSRSAREVSIPSGR